MILLEFAILWMVIISMLQRTLEVTISTLIDDPLMSNDVFVRHSIELSKDHHSIISINSCNADCDKSRSTLDYQNDTIFIFLVKRPFIQVPTCPCSREYKNMLQVNQVNSSPQRASGALRPKCIEESCWPGQFFFLNRWFETRHKSIQI